MALPVSPALPLSIGDYDPKVLSIYIGKSFLLLWDAGSPDYLMAVLMADGVVTCACFSPTHNFIVIAGTEDGSLAAWDLRESRASSSAEVERMFSDLCGFRKDRRVLMTRLFCRIPQMVQRLNLQCPCRGPSYSTQNMGVTNTHIHTSKITAVTPIPNPTDPSRGQLSFQLASIDDRGLVTFWLLNEISVSDPPHPLCPTTED